MKNNRRGETDFGCLAMAFLVFGGAAIGGIVGYEVGWDAGVRDAVAGKATVITKPDGTTEACKVKESTNDGK